MKMLEGPNRYSRFLREKVSFGSFRVTGLLGNGRHGFGICTLIKCEKMFSILDKFLEV